MQKQEKEERERIKEEAAKKTKRGTKNTMNMSRNRGGGGVHARDEKIEDRQGRRGGHIYRRKYSNRGQIYLLCGEWSHVLDTLPKRKGKNLL